MVRVLTRKTGQGGPGSGRLSAYPLATIFILPWAMSFVIAKIVNAMPLKPSGKESNGNMKPPILKKT